MTTRPQITHKRVLLQLRQDRWRVWSEIAEDITGEPATITDVRHVRDITHQLQEAGFVVEHPRKRLLFKAVA